MEDNDLLKYFDMTNRFNTNKTLRRGNIENSPDYILEIKRPIINKLIKFCSSKVSRIYGAQSILIADFSTEKSAHFKCLELYL